jgi:hypothetical protein
VRGTTVGEVVALYPGQDGVPELHQRRAGGDLLRFLGIEPATWLAGINGAEAANLARSGHLYLA